MEEKELSPLDTMLLRGKSVTVKREIASKVTRGMVPCYVTVIQLVPLGYSIVTVLYEARSEPEIHTYMGNKEQRDRKLEQINLPPSSFLWLKGE